MAHALLVLVMLVLSGGAADAGPIVAAVAISAAAGGIGVALGTVTVASAAVAVGVTAATAGIGYLAGNGRSRGSETVGDGVPANPIAQPAPVNAQRSIPIRQPIPPRRFVYGRTRIGGAVFFEDNKNPYLLIGAALSDGVIDAIEQVYFGDVVIPLDVSGNATSATIYSGKLYLEAALGTDTQAASAVILANFPTFDANFRQRGVARAVARLDWGSDAINNSALWGSTVDPAYIIRGVKVYDPRNGAQSPTDKSTWAYSDNIALHVAHAITNAWGVAMPQSYMNWASVAAAANVCDTTVIYGGVSKRMFIGAGVFQSGSDMASQLAQMLSGMDGAILYADGQYKLYADAPRSSVWTITADDILDIPEFPFDNEARERFGAVRAAYYDATSGGKNTTTTVLELVSGGRETSLALPFTSESHSAQILAYRSLKRSQKSQTFNITVTDAGLWLDPFDVITISDDAMAFLNGAYIVLHAEPAQEGVTLLLRPYDATVYNDPAGYLT